jgi:multiple sugar transport system permease protein
MSIIFKNFGWVDTFKPLWVQSFLGLSAFFIFLLRQFFLTIPNDLSDAAKLDGCSELGILWRIVLPLSKPAIFTVVLFEFLWTWNDFLNPLIYLSDSSKFTLSVGLKFFQGMRSAQWALLMAASSLITVPIIILFFFTQRTFIQGITLTGLKG